MILPCGLVAMMAWPTASSSRAWKRICSSAFLRPVMSPVLVTQRLHLGRRKWVASFRRSWIYNRRRRGERLALDYLARAADLSRGCSYLLDRDYTNSGEHTFQDLRQMEL